MSVDIVYVASNSILFVIELIIFIFTYRIFKNTEGASLAYKKWAIATFLLLIGATIYVSFGILAGANETSNDSINEFHKILARTIQSLGFFYLPIGFLYLSRDLDIASINESSFRKYQIVFYSLIISIFIVSMLFLPFFDIIRPTGIVFNLMYVFIWVLSLTIFEKAYPILKTVNSCWSFLRIALWASLFHDVFYVLYLTFSDLIEPLILVTELFMAFGFIVGFYKLAKMVEAI